MDSEAARHPDTPGRLRVVDLRIGGERRQLHFGGGFACVVTETSARSAAARWIAKTIVEPAREGFEGSAADEPVWRLQAPLLPLRVPAVLDRDLLQTLWRSDCERRLEELTASRESVRSEREGIEAALDRLRIQPPLTPAAATSGNATGTPVRSPAAEAELAAFKASAQRFVRVQSLLATIDALVPVPSPEALELADAWDAHLAIPLGAFPTAEAPTPEPAQAADPPRPARAPSPRETDPAADARRAELDRLHRTTVKAEARLFRRGLMPRKRAVEKYNAARLREQAALAGAGVDSYAEFLITSHANARAEHEHDDAHDEADDAPDVKRPVATNRGDDAEVAPEIPIEDEYAARVARTEELRAQARALLGHEPGEDVAGELRAHLAPPAAREEHVEQLAGLLREEGLADLDDVVGRARVFIATPPSVHIPQPPTWAMRVSRPNVPLREIEGLEIQLAEKDERLEALAVENTRLVAARESDLLRLGPDDFVRVLDAMFDAYRAGEVLEGHLPLVLDGVLDGLAADVRDAAVLALANVDDAQVIVVTDDDTVTQRVGAAGGTIVRWPAPEDQRRGPAPERWSSTRG